MMADVMADAGLGSGEARGDDAVDSRGKGSRARKRQAPKAAETDKRSLNLRVDVATYERLTVHAMKRRITISQLVADLAAGGCKDYAIHKVAQRGDGSGEA